MRVWCFAFVLMATLLSAQEVATATDRADSDGYTINYNTISMVEYLKFASKVCKTNFIYEETDLDFTVTVLSDEPVTPQNVMATLLQVLRVHGLLLLEQDNNLVIHKTADVRQAATLVVDGKETKAPIVTRIFRLKNAKPESIAQVVQPMISSSALLEVSSETRQLILTDVTANVDKIAQLIENLDSPHTLFDVKTFVTQHNTPDALISLATQILAPIAQGNPLILVPQNPTRTVYIVSTPELSDRAIAILTSLDQPPKEQIIDAPGYYIYRVQHTTGDLIEEDLDQFVKNMDHPDMRLSEVVNKIRYVKETNSLLLHGDQTALEEVKQLIAQYDYPRKNQLPASSNFYLYKPQHLPPDQVEKSLRDVASTLKTAGLADASLLKAIDTAKYVSSTNSLIFTGPPETLVKVQELLKDVDVPRSAHAGVQHVGENTFLLYKIKNATGAQLVESIKTVTADIKKGGSDKEFLKALQSMKYVKETNSLFFSGSEGALTRVQGLIEQFDVMSQASGSTGPKGAVPMSGPSNFFVYRPQSLNGPDLEKMIEEFGEHLKSSGLYDPELFSAIASMRWTDKTQTLVFTGSTTSLDRIKELLKEFDIPSNVPVGGLGAEGGAAIQSIDNTSFLVYKLQFHKGDEIQGALRQIAKDLTISNAPINQGLLNSINSIQWLEVTNSLLCSGDQETLTRLRELIKNLDIPLKQVFIEMLVIQTNLTNALTFGLEWGGNYKYRNKFGAAGYNSQPILSQSSGAAPSTFLQNLSGLVPPASPTPVGKIPPSSGFDLGIIGEVIRHNGESFLTLGSLLTALQTDDETTVVMTPKLITQDGRTSSIFVGENIPFVGSFVQNNGQNVVNTSNLEYRDIGFSLTVTPVLGNSDIVTLDINLDRSQTTNDVTGAAINFNSQSAQGIITSRTTMQTTVHVPDNHFLILSGMVNNSTAKSKAGIPCLGGLPLVGAAFSKNNDVMTNSNIVIFIRPHIINSAEDMRALSTKEENFFRDQAGTPYLERHFDEAMELIKTIDDD